MAAGEPSQLNFISSVGIGRVNVLGSKGGGKSYASSGCPIPADNKVMIRHLDGLSAR
jgi:hypothetical protein